MEDMDRYVTELSAAVWEQTLGLPLDPTVTVPDTHGRTVEGHVHISGEWNGTLVFQCSIGAARQAAHVMFGPGDDHEGLSDVQDAVGELTNMIGGNLKSLLSEDGCFLSLPMVIEGSDYTVRMSGARVIVRQTFMSDHEPVVVTLLEPSRVN
jgi:chemotaxis protein CheX